MTFKRLAERDPTGRTLYRGYMARCANCGQLVVHAKKTGKPFHVHLYSKKCVEDGRKLRAKEASSLARARVTKVRER